MCPENWEMRSVYKIFVEKPERKRPFGRPKSRQEDNIGTGYKEIGSKNID
jgi:hypothetical protein